MQENVIAQGTSSVPVIVKKISNALFIASAILGAILYILNMKWKSLLYEKVGLYRRYGFSTDEMLSMEVKMDQISDIENTVFIFLIISIVLTVIFFVVRIPAGNRIIVTKDKVCGIAIFGKKVDLLWDSISSVEVVALKGIAIISASGRKYFYGIKNYNEIYNQIQSILRNNQNQKMISELSNQANIKNDMDELIKYKELLDQGIITQEEFDAKKKQLLGI